MKRYITYEEQLQGYTFTENQMHGVYKKIVDKQEYPTFDIWFADMLKSGVFEEVEA